MHKTMILDIGEHAMKKSQKLMVRRILKRVFLSNLIHLYLIDKRSFAHLHEASQDKNPQHGEQPENGRIIKVSLNMFT